MQTIAPLWLWATFPAIVLVWPGVVVAILALTMLLNLRSATAWPKA